MDLSGRRPKTDIPPALKTYQPVSFRVLRRNTSINETDAKPHGTHAG
jgi:hypothetical protein